MLKTLENTRFANSPIIAVAAKPGGPDAPETDAIGVKELIDCLNTHVYFPKRDPSGSFIYSVDHCFSIRGQGTVMTGTILNGTVNVNDTVEIPSMKVTKKVKSMQMFRKPIQKASQGDRVGICVTQFDPKQLERGLVCTPNALPTIFAAVARVHKIPYFKGKCETKSKFHLTIGHDTVMAKLLFFGPPPGMEAEYGSDLDFDKEYIYQEELLDSTKVISQKSGVTPLLQFVLVELERPVTCAIDSLVIGSRLDTDINLNTCRLSFHGKLIEAFSDKDYNVNFLPKLKIFKTKGKEGIVERIADDYSVIVKSLFKKETNLQTFTNLKVQLSSGETGVIEGSFGQSGKVKVRIPTGLTLATKGALGTTQKKKGKGKQDAAQASTPENAETSGPIKVALEFKKYIFDTKHKIIQS